MTLCLVVQLNFLLLYKYVNAISIDIIGGIKYSTNLGVGHCFYFSLYLHCNVWGRSFNESKETYFQLYCYVFLNIHQSNFQLGGSIPPTYILVYEK